MKYSFFLNTIKNDKRDSSLGMEDVRDLIKKIKSVFKGGRIKYEVKTESGYTFICNKAYAGVYGDTLNFYWKDLCVACMRATDVLEVMDREFDRIVYQK